MEIINSVVSTITGIGGAVLFPLLFFILGLFFRMKVGDALISGLKIGVGYLGITVMYKYLLEVVSPATAYYVALGEGFTVTDVPWPVIGGLIGNLPNSFLLYPILFVLGILLVRFKVFKTLHLELWSYGAFILSGAYAQVLFNSTALGYAVAIIAFVTTVAGGDIWGKKWASYLGLTNTTSSSGLWMYWGSWPIIVVNWILDRIPYVKDIKITPKTMVTKLGVLGETSVIGAVVGAFLAIITKQDIKGIVTMSMGVMAAVVLMPHVLKFFMEGMAQISIKAAEWASKVLGKDREIYLAVNIAMSVGDPVAITVGTLLFPILFLLPFVLPNFHYFPIGFTTVIVYLAGWCTMQCKGDFFRSLVSSIAVLTVLLLTANFVIPEATEIFRVASGDPNAASVTSVVFADWPYLILSLIKRALAG